GVGGAVGGRWSGRGTGRVRGRSVVGRRRGVHRLLQERPPGLSLDRFCLLEGALGGRLVGHGRERRAPTLVESAGFLEEGGAAPGGVDARGFLAARADRKSTR